MRRIPAILAGPRSMGLITALAVFAMGSFYLYKVFQEQRKEIQRTSALQAGFLGEQLLRKFESLEAITESMQQLPLESTLSQAEFTARIAQLRRIAGAGASLEWAPDAVTQFATPLSDSSSVENRNFLLADPSRHANIQDVINARRPQWAGPLPLVGGGQGMVYRVPVFAPPSTRPQGDFVGLAKALVRFPDVLAPLLKQSSADHHYTVSIGLSDQPPASIWDDETDPQHEHQLGGGFDSGLSRPATDAGAPVLKASPTPRVQVRAFPRQDLTTQELPKDVLRLTLLATLIGWATATATRLREEHQRMAAQSAALVRLEGMVAERTLSLTQARDFSDTLLDSMGSVFVLVDTEGRIERFNQTGQHITGRPLADLSGQPFDVLLTPASRDAARHAFASLLQGETLVTVEAELLTKHGGRLFSWQCTVLRDAARQVTHVMATGIDIADQRALQSRLEAQGTVLERTVEERTLALSRLQARYLKLFQESPDAYLLIDQATLIVRTGNDAAARLFRCTPDRLTDAPLLELMPAKQPGGVPSAAIVQQTITRCLREGHHGFDWVHRRMDDTNFHAEVAVQATQVDQATMLFVSLRDITVRKLLEAQVAARNAEIAATAQRLELATRALGLGIWNWDLRSNEVVWDAALFEMFGIPPAQRTNPLAPALWHERVSPEDLGGVEDYLRRQMADPSPKQIEYRIQRADATTAYFGMATYLVKDKGGVPIQMIGVNWDITERKEMQLRYEAEARKLSIILANVRVGIVMATNGYIDWVNTYFAEMLGYAAADLIGQPTRRLLAEDTSFILESQAYAAYAQGPRSDMRIRLRRADSQDFAARITAQAITEDDLKAGIVGMVRDVSAEEHRERILITAKQEAEAANLAKIQLLANASHELRTPVNVMHGLLQALELSPLSGQQHDYVGRALRASKSLQDLIDDVLDFARTNAGTLTIERHVFSPRLLINEQLANHLPLAQAKQLELGSSLSARLPAWLLGDDARVSQIISNLLGNAIKYTLEGCVRLEADWTGNEVTGNLILHVVDTGIGISPEHLAHVFDRFYRANDNVATGLGLGLPIVKGLIEQMGGTIEVSSTLESGSRFSVRLPLDIAPAAPAADSALAAERPLAGLRILVAEDNPDNQLVIRVLLEQLGAAVHLASDGGKAVRCAQEADPCYDAVLMDMRMPVMNGREATRAIRATARLGKLPIVALTANASPADRLACREAGMTDFIAKPVDRHALVATLLAVCRASAAMPAAPQPVDTRPSGHAPVIVSPPGFDLSSALDRLGYNTKIYAVMAQSFIAAQEEMLARLRQLLTSPYSGEATADYLHTLRGSAMSLGAEALAQMLYTAESQAAQPTSPDLSEWLPPLVAAMEQARQGLSTILAKHEFDTPMLSTG